MNYATSICIPLSSSAIWLAALLEHNLLALYGVMETGDQMVMCLCAINKSGLINPIWLDRGIEYTLHCLVLAF